MSGNYKQDIAVVARMQAMCEESLCPDHFEMWETIKDALFETRSSLQVPCENCHSTPVACVGPETCERLKA